MLEVDEVNVSYGETQVLRDVSLIVNEKEIVTLIGTNGAGKTTLMRTISGIKKAQSGAIKFMGSRIDGLEPHQIVKLGIAHVSQKGNLFPDLTVADNLELGTIQLAEKEKDLEKLFDQVYRYFEVLRKRQHQQAGSLSGGEQRMLAIARALMSLPKFILLDEPSSGLAPVLVEELAKIINEVQEEGELTILLTEQNASLAFQLSSRGYVLQNGAIVASDKTSELAGAELVKKAYLGL